MALAAARRQGGTRLLYRLIEMPAALRACGSVVRVVVDGLMTAPLIVMQLPPVDRVATAIAAPVATQSVGEVATAMPPGPAIVKLESCGPLPGDAGSTDSAAAPLRPPAD